MAQQQGEVLRDLSDIARDSNDSQPSSSTSLPIRERLLQAEAGTAFATTSGSVWNVPPPITATTPDGPFINSSTQTPDRPPITANIFTSRDANAIQYTKSLLNEGDTLVIVRFPNNTPVYDTTGFRLSDTHRVNSHKLKAASPIFKKVLEDDWQQHRFKRRNKLMSGLPPGIQYVLDLTPPDEGDDALELTAELSCSLGIRRWYMSEFSDVAASHGLVGGQDETTVHPNFPTTDDSPEVEREVVDADATMSNNTFGMLRDGDTDEVLERALQQDENNFKQKTSQESDYTRSHIGKDKEIETLDYCPIRHRTGIARLLQIIEGKEPRLDSAPKVWTVAVLAKHFECPNSVIDYIVTWMIAEPNCKIFEILPEDCLRIGLMLQSEVVTRYAFTILVSEEALRVGSARSELANQPNTNYAAGKQVTKFGRARESLDEDTLNLIQHAGRNFHASIEQQVQMLMSPNMNWLTNLPEFTKLTKIKDFIDLGTNGKFFHPQDERSVNAAIEEILNYVRGRLLWCFYQPLDTAERVSWREHRAQERHQRDKGPTISDSIINDLAEHEKILTRSFWSQMRVLKWNVGDTRCTTNLIRDQSWPRSAAVTGLEAKAVAAADAQGIPKIFLRGIESSVHLLNKIILGAIRDANFNDGKFPDESFMVERIVEPMGTEETARWGQRSSLLDHQKAQKTIDEIWRPESQLVDVSDMPILPSLPDPGQGSSDRPGFWQEALKARDMAIERDGSDAEYSPEIKDEAQDPWSNDYIIAQGAEGCQSKTKSENSPSWAKLQKIWNEEQESKGQKTVPIPSRVASTYEEQRYVHKAPKPSDALKEGPDYTPGKNVSWSLHPEAMLDVQHQARGYTDTFYDPTSAPHVPTDSKIMPSSPFFSLARLFFQIECKLQVICTRMLSRGEIGDVRPPTCDICDTLLCLGDEEYKYLPLWAGGLNDGSGGVFEEAIPPAERGGAIGPGPAYRTGSTANSRASTDSGFDFEGGGSIYGSSDSVMGGVNTSVGVEDGWSVDHVDRRRVFSEAEFMTPTASEDGSVVFVGDEDVEMDLPIREKGKGRAVDDWVGDLDETNQFNQMSGSSAIEKEQAVLLSMYSGKGKEKEVNEQMVDVQPLGGTKGVSKKTANVSMDDDENFFNTADDDTEFDFESDDDGDLTETEDDFEHIG
ncbi:hypothetical protein VTL71DRAFT_13196 [Oculimacula yallundae]|uniref:BTB domain-containing protein n=1 Tax=Oculimacula yallundae TaxID=86028 RepID=A0ABR4CJN0_9HELO